MAVLQLQRAGISLQRLLWSTIFKAVASSCSSSTLEHRLRCCGPWLRCSMACGIVLNQGPNSRLLHWQADSLSLSHQRIPIFDFSSLRFHIIRVWTRAVYLGSLSPKFTQHFRRTLELNMLIFPILNSYQGIWLEECNFFFLLCLWAPSMVIYIYRYWHWLDR